MHIENELQTKTVYQLILTGVKMTYLEARFFPQSNKWSVKGNKSFLKTILTKKCISADSSDMFDNFSKHNLF